MKTRRNSLWPRPSLRDVAASGEAVGVFDAWFGPQVQEPIQRKFKIQAD